jgi:F-box protein, helicase, 18
MARNGPDAIWPGGNKVRRFLTPTSEQEAILATPPTSTIKVAAGAGCGKTSTLAAYGRRWQGPGLYVAFNKSIATEARSKFPSHIETRTGHSVAYRALKIAERGVPIAKYRFEHLRPYDDLIKGVAGMTDGQVRAAILRTLNNFLIDAGSKLKPEHCALADTGQRNAVRRMVLDIAGRLLRLRDHDLPITHDTYLKAFELWDRIEGDYEYLLLDEAQDLNPVMVSIAAKSGLPTIVVGDSHQSIYRFRGAVDALGQFAAETLPLSLSWRFGPEVARLANRVLSHHSSPPKYRLRGNPDRHTEVLRYTGQLKAGTGTAVLARTNARLFESLARVTRPFHLIGGIKELQRQLSSAYALRHRQLYLVIDETVARFTSWAALDNAAERGDYDARRLRDIIDRYGEQLPAILARLGTLHREREADAHLIVSTAHKAKGREFTNVVVLDDFELPSELVKRRRKDPAQLHETNQLINLLYVACTRATDRLYLSESLFEALC